MAGFIFIGGATISFKAGPSNIEKLRPQIDGRFSVSMELSDDELEAALWGLENHHKVKNGMGELKQTKMHEISLFMTEAKCTCGWSAKHDPDRHVFAPSLANVHASSNRPATIKDERL